MLHLSRQLGSGRTSVRHRGGSGGMDRGGGLLDEDAGGLARLSTEPRRSLDTSRRGCGIERPFAYVHSRHLSHVVLLRAFALIERLSRTLNP